MSVSSCLLQLVFEGLVSVRGNGQRGETVGGKENTVWTKKGEKSKTSQENITVHPVAHMVTQRGGPGRNTVLE